ncbi:MAG: hypothetical protein IJV31_03335, partial [Clostridia bacterium]|nr:hypothetical protein [Clostridia bacterium]
YYKGQDQYDINGNLKTTETVNKVNVGLSLVSPQSLLTNQTATNYDKDGSKTIAPQEAIVDKDQRQANVNINILNNYSGTISQVQILGKIPFEGNTYVLNTNELGSNYSTTMTNAGIILPDELKATAKVYYSTNENPTKDLEDSSNGWTTTPEDFSKVKTFLIDLGDHVLARGESQDFYYTINLPQDAQYNEVSYSSHAVYFSLDTENGKYRTQTEPNKLGFRVEREFDVELTKYQEATNKVVPEATYSLQEEGTEETKTRVTDENGTLKLTNLKVDKTYILKEIKTPSEYELNTDTIKFKIYEENNELKVQVLEGTTRNIRIETKQDENSVLKIEVEDREKANLKIVKVEAGTENAIKGVRFKITGTDLSKTLTTNASGEVNLKGLKIGEEYTIEEVKAEGYYLNTPITFKIIKNGSEYSLDVNGNKVKQNSITKENEIPTINLKIENDKIPTFDLELNKVAKGETTALEGAKFKLYKGTTDKGTFETDENGKIQITGLYQYEEERALDQTYTLKEIKAPDGYAKVKDITFYVEEVEGKLTAKITSGNVKEQTSEGNNVSLTIEDSPSFKLIKKETGTETLLPNCKFAIYNVDDGDENAKPATNSKGEIIGVKETINGEDYYVVTTNDKGEITADLKEGLYKAVEVDAPEQYDITDATYYFAIGDIKAEQNPIVAKWATSYGGTSVDYINSVAETSDGGIIAGGYFQGTIQVGNMTLTSKGSTDGILIKYDNTGKVEWAESYGGTSNDTIYSVCETSDGGIIAGGYSGGTIQGGTIQVGDITLRNKGGYDGIVIKYDNEGKVEWAESHGSASDDTIYSVCETSDGGIIAGGYFYGTVQVGNMTLTSKGSCSDGILIKYDNTGEVEWATSYGGTNYDYIYSVAETSDGGIIG